MVVFVGFVVILTTKLLTSGSMIFTTGSLIFVAVVWGSLAVMVTVGCHGLILIFILRHTLVSMHLASTRLVAVVAGPVVLSAA